MHANAFQARSPTSSVVLECANDQSAFPGRAISSNHLFGTLRAPIGTLPPFTAMLFEKLLDAAIMRPGNSGGI